MKTDESVNIGKKSDSRNLAQRKHRERLVLPSELDSLSDLTAIVKFNNYHHVLSQWEYKSYQNNHPSFIMREGLEVKAKNYAPPEIPKEREDENNSALDEETEINNDSKVTVGFDTEI